MKKLMIAGLILAAVSLTMQGTDFTITLQPSFLQYNGVYKFVMDVQGKAIDKEFKVSVADGKATLITEKGVKGKKITIKDNVIHAKVGVLKTLTAKDLEIFGLDGQFKGQSASMGLKKDSKSFNVDIGPGLMFAFMKKPTKDLLKTTYEYSIGPNLPNGSYTIKFIIPAAKDKIYKFDVQDHKISKVISASTGTTIKDDVTLVIDAYSMCAKRTTKKAFAILGVGLPVAVGTAAVEILSGGTATPAVVGIYTGAIAATAGAYGGGAMAIGGAISGEGAGAAFGFRDATAQLTCDSGEIKGYAVKFDYDECRNNQLLMNLVPEKVNITGKK